MAVEGVSYNLDPLPDPDWRGLVMSLIWGEISIDL